MPAKLPAVLDALLSLPPFQSQQRPRPVHVVAIEPVVVDANTVVDILHCKNIGGSTQHADVRKQVGMLQRRPRCCGLAGAKNMALGLPVCHQPEGTKMASPGC